MASLKFVPFSSEIELPFYSSLFALKIDHDKLDDSARPVLGGYEPRQAAIAEPGCRMQILGNALTSNQGPAGFIRAEGIIKNVNTAEEFKNMDKGPMLQTAGKQIWDAIVDGTIYSVPSLLSSFTVLSFANLKKYRFVYWFAFPALHSEPSWTQTDAVEHMTGSESTALVDRVGTWKYSVDSREHGFFLAKKVRSSSVEDESGRPTTPGTPGDELGFTWEVGSLRDYEAGFFNDAAVEDRYVAFVDPSTYAEHPGWMLRNLLVLIRYRFKLSKVQVLCFRDIHARRHEARSIILHLQCGNGEPAPDDASQVSMPKVTGWERSGGKLTPKVIDLAHHMDPERIADQSVDLNLKLMKWRIAPGLDLGKIKDTKCLLLGAGTLGSYVSRNLMGWGVRHITFIDNAKVSFSNPVRQPLFDFKDCLNGGVQKAHRAAEVLQEIYPGASSQGHVMSVPMLGHPVVDEEKVKKDYEQLKQLIDEHDVVFLLMDTRESRWLPTVMGKAAGKIVMNAALGFDSYVVMRHGLSRDASELSELGCYFCNDVVTPANSTKDQTLDQQCTVTRPGVAAIASALLVELLVSVLQHPKGGLASAPTPTTVQSTVTYERDPDDALGLVPHQIRGFLWNFQNLIINGKAYDCCSGCSPKILGAFQRDGWEFVKRALSDKDYVAELSGLAEVQRQAEAAAATVEWESDGEEGLEDGDGELL